MNKPGGGFTPNVPIMHVYTQIHDLPTYDCDGRLARSGTILHACNWYASSHTTDAVVVEVDVYV